MLVKEMGWSVPEAKSSSSPSPSSSSRRKRTRSRGKSKERDEAAERIGRKKAPASVDSLPALIGRRLTLIFVALVLACLASAFVHFVAVNKPRF